MKEFNFKDHFEKRKKELVKERSLKAQHETIPYTPILGKYIPTSLVNHTFRDSTVTHVDKTHTGNGFTFAFMYEIKPKKGYTNLLIEVNTGVVKNKHLDYIEKKKLDKHLPNIQFLYGGYTSDKIIDLNADLIVTTVDSFKYSEDQLKLFRFDKILLDEFHTLHQQKTFRSVLRPFYNHLISKYKTSSIVSVTATPSVYQYSSRKDNFNRINFILQPTTIEPRELHINNNYKEVIEEALHYTDNTDHNVVVFTNDMKVISHFTEVNKNRKRELNANLIVGNQLNEKLVRKFIVNNREDLYIISTKGFEGLDIESENNEVYIFQDTNSPAEEFILSNINQAIGRPRKGYNKATYCSIHNSEEYPCIDNIIRKVRNSNLKDNYWLSKSKLASVARLSKSEIIIFTNCVIQFQDNLSREYHCVIDSDMRNIYREKYMFLNKGIEDDLFKNYLETRKIEIVIEDRKSVSIKGVGLNTTHAEYYLKENRDYILTHKINEANFHFNYQKKKYDLLKDMSHIDLFVKQWNKYKQLLNFEGDYIFTDKQLNINTLFEPKKKKNINTYPNFEVFLKRVFINYRVVKDSLAYESEHKKKECKSKFKKSMKLQALKTIAVLINDDISISSQKNKGREYSIITELKLSLIKDVCDLLDRTVVEIDIRTCNPRILYALCGLELPEDFYSKDKKNKNRINILLNDFTSDTNKTKLLDKTYKYKKKESFREFGFDEKVITYLFENFYDMSKSYLSSVLASYENEIIDELKKEYTNGLNVIRRHDSILIFDGSLSKSVDEFEFLGIKGWFKKVEQVIENKVDLSVSTKNLDENIQEILKQYNDTSEITFIEDFSNDVMINEDSFHITYYRFNTIDYRYVVHEDIVNRYEYAKNWIAKVEDYDIRNEDELTVFDRD